MVKGTIIEEKNCFSDDSARRFMQTIQQTSCNINNPDLSLHSSPSRPYPLCLSGFREVKSEEINRDCLYYNSFVELPA